MQLLIQQHPHFRSYIVEDINWAIGRRMEIQELRQNRHRLLSNIPKTQNKPIHKLPHCPKWDLLIDESGHSFNADTQMRSRSCVVGVLAPADNKLNL